MGNKMKEKLRPGNEEILQVDVRMKLEEATRLVVPTWWDEEECCHQIQERKEKVQEKSKKK